MWISVPPRGVEPKSLALQRGFLTLDHQGGPWLDYCRREWQMLKSSGTGERGFYWERRTGAWKKQWRTGRAPIPPPGPVVWGSGRKHLTLFAATSLAPTMGAHKWESLNKYLLSDWVISSLCLGKRLSRKLIQVHCERWAGMGRGEVQRDLLRGHWMGQVGRGRNDLWRGSGESKRGPQWGRRPVTWGLWDPWVRKYRADECRELARKELGRSLCVWRLFQRRCWGPGKTLGYPR